MHVENKINLYLLIKNNFIYIFNILFLNIIINFKFN